MCQSEEPGRPWISFEERLDSTRESSAMNVSVTFGDLVREYFPGVTDEEVECILWEKTGFPTFWNIPVDGNTPEECCRKQLQEYKDKLQRGKI